MKKQLSFDGIVSNKAFLLVITRCWRFINNYYQHCDWGGCHIQLMNFCKSDKWKILVKLDVPILFWCPSIMSALSFQPINSVYAMAMAFVVLWPKQGGCWMPSFESEWATQSTMRNCLRFGDNQNKVRFKNQLLGKKCPPTYHYRPGIQIYSVFLPAIKTPCITILPI